VNTEEDRHEHVVLQAGDLNPLRPAPAHLVDCGHFRRLSDYLLAWLAFFFILVVTQGAHLREHVAQMVQIHLLGLSGLQARGILGMLDIEWVHFIWNAWVLLCTVLLVLLFRKNPWLWVLLVISVWHEMEHVSIMSVFLHTGHAGAPGLLAHGGGHWRWTAS
jgi:hypothetical protein